jgi:hypothetical protein
LVKVFLNDPDAPPLNPPKPAAEKPTVPVKNPTFSNENPDDTSPTDAPSDTTGDAGTPSPTSPATSGGNQANNAKLNEYLIKMKLNKLTVATQVRLDITDDNGTRTVFDELHAPGDRISKSTRGAGSQVVFTLYYDGVANASWVQKPGGKS